MTLKDLDSERINRKYMDTCSSHGLQVYNSEFLGTYKVFLVENFATKTRDNPFNEARGAVDITEDVKHLTFQLSELNPIGIDTRLQGRPRKDFKFGSDDYIYFIANKKNEF